MLNCEGLLTAGIQKDCDNNPVAGLEVNVVIMNIEDVNKTVTTFDVTTDLIITNLACKSGKTGFIIEGVKSTTFGVSYELVKNDYANSYKHVFSGAIVNPTAENRKQLEILSSGARFVLVVEKKWKGETQKHAFEVYGYNNGLEGSTVTYNSKENNGVIMFELASEEGGEEPRIPYNYLDTDYATSSAAFVNKFATV